MLKLSRTLLLAGLALSAVGCSDDAVNSDEQARRAYLGLDGALSRALRLGFKGFNEASSANISPQSEAGDASGTLTVSGQVDQGASANKGMRLFVGATDYSDGPFEVAADDEPVSIRYDTSETEAERPRLDLSLRGIPDGTFTGTLAGDFTMHGHLDGIVTLDLAFAGGLESDGSGGVQRRATGTTVKGTAVAGEGTYAVDLSL